MVTHETWLSWLCVAVIGNPSSSFIPQRQKQIPKLFQTEYIKLIPVEKLVWTCQPFTKSGHCPHCPVSQPEDAKLNAFSVSLQTSF